MYEVITDSFSGPFEKLLELIEGKKLEVTSLSLAKVTEDFFDYIRRIETKADSALIADFVVIASKLLLIKSKALLPDLALSIEEERDINELEGRLKVYREFKNAAQHIRNLWSPKPQMFGKELLVDFGEHGVFYPAENITVDALFERMRKLFSLLKQLVPDETTVKRNVITLEATVHDLMTRFQGSGSHSFSSIAKDKPRGEIIVFFLAVLHLLRDQLIEVEQGEKFGEIALKKKEDV